MTPRDSHPPGHLAAQWHLANDAELIWLSYWPLATAFSRSTIAWDSDYA